MNKYKDETGNRYGALVALHYTRSARGGGAYWMFRCDCGKQFETRCNNLRARLSKGCYPSCGCLVRKSANPRILSRFKAKYYNAKKRCSDEQHLKYRHYGGRGIKFLWDSYRSFEEDMYQSYIEHWRLHGYKDTTIDRIDVNGDYCKENCRWATRKEQRANTRRNLTA